MLNLCESIAFDSRRRRIVSSRTRETFGRNCFLRGLQREPRCKENESRSLICGTRFKFKALLFFSMQESLANQSRRLRWKEFSKNFCLSSPPPFRATIRNLCGKVWFANGLKHRTLSVMNYYGLRGNLYGILYCSQGGELERLTCYVASFLPRFPSIIVPVSRQ